MKARRLSLPEGRTSESNYAHKAASFRVDSTTQESAMNISPTTALTRWKRRRFSNSLRIFSEATRQGPHDQSQRDLVEPNPHPFHKTAQRPFTGGKSSHGPQEAPIAARGERRVPLHAAPNGRQKAA